MYGLSHRMMIPGINVVIIITATTMMSQRPLETMCWIIYTVYRKTRHGQQLHLYQ